MAGSRREDEQSPRTVESRKSCWRGGSGLVLLGTASAWAARAGTRWELQLAWAAGGAVRRVKTKLRGTAAGSPDPVEMAES